MRLLRFERRQLRAIFEAIVPSGADERLTLGVADIPLDRFIDDLMVHAPTQFRVGLRASLWLIALSPLVVVGRLRFFDGLEDAAKLELLHRLGQSEIYLVRELPLLFKMVACLAFGGMPDVHRQLGIHPTDKTPPPWAEDTPQQ